MLILNVLLRVSIATLLLIIGGISIYNHDLFMERIYHYLPLSWMFASIFSRIVIGFILLIGIIILYIKITRKVKILLAAIFTFLFLDYFLMTAVMNSLPLLYKFDTVWSIVFCSLGVILSLTIPISEKLLRPKWIISLPIIGTLVWILAVNPIQGFRFYQSTSDYELTEFPITDFLELDSLNVVGQEKVIVAFLSTTCPHCMENARRLAIMFGDNNTFVKAYFPDHNSKERMNDFFRINGDIQLQYQLIPSKLFSVASGGALPSLFYFENGKPVSHFSGYSLTLPTLDLFRSLKTTR